MRERKYTAKFIISIINEHLETGKGSKVLSAKYGINDARVAEWLKEYHARGVDSFFRDGKNKSYDISLKKRAVEDYLTGKGSIQEITLKYGIRCRKQLREWIKVYNSGRRFQHKISGGSRMKETRSTTLEERVQIAKDCMANGGNYGETALKYNVSYQQVYQWTKKFKEMGAAGLEDRRGKRLKDQTPRTREEELEIEVAKLKHELYMTQMERDLLKKLDEIERREAYRK